MRKLIFALLLSTLPAWCVGAGTYCVTADGAVPSPNPHNCLAGKTFTTLALALAALNAEQGATAFSATQTIYISPGTYTYSGLVQVGFISTGKFLAPSATYPLVITSASGAQAVPGGTQPIISCTTTSVEPLYLYASYMTVQGIEFTHCKDAITFGSTGPRSNETIAYNYIHATGSNASIVSSASGIGAGTWVHHNILASVGAGISWIGAAWTVEFNEIGITTNGNGIASGGLSIIRNNIIYGTYITTGSGIQGGNNDTITGNVGYDDRYCIQSQITAAPGPTFTNNICVANMWTCHYEGGASSVYGLMQHNFCYRSTNAGVPADSGQVQRIGAGPGSAAFEINNISWPSQAVSVNDKNIYAGSMAASMSDYNDWWLTGTPGRVIAGFDSANYTSLSAFQAGTGWDTHSFSANPRILGDPDLLVATTQVFPECPNIECRLAKIRRNYMPTNLALKGKGCTWNASAMTCTPDHSDIGPVPITVYNAPGITGGGVY